MRLRKQTHPGQRGRLSLRHQRHSVVGVLTIQRAQSDWLPALPSVVSAKGSRADGRHLTLRKAVSEERPQSIGGESLPKSLLSQMEQGEKERMRERGCNTTNAHLQKERERERGQSYKEPGRQREKVATPSEIHAARHTFFTAKRHSSLIPGNECLKVSCDSLRVKTLHLLRHDSPTLLH